MTEKNHKKRLPEWMKVPMPGLEKYAHVRKLLEEQHLHTVCQSARCPNIGECFGHGTATFMILGDVCTRNCRFCKVSPGKPEIPDPEEPEHLANAAVILNLQHVVITSVTRDDLNDGGASHFVRVIEAIRKKSPDMTIEVLIPDFQGSESALRSVLAANPDVLNHNIETVPRLYPKVRPSAIYERSLVLLKRAALLAPEIPTKSGIMVGCGEEWEEIIAVLTDLRRHQCSAVTIGQYLAPGPEYHPVARFVSPDEFKKLEDAARALGFIDVQSGPLVRSSYHAHTIKTNMDAHSEKVE